MNKNFTDIYSVVTYIIKYRRRKWVVIYRLHLGTNTKQDSKEISKGRICI